MSSEDDELNRGVSLNLFYFSQRGYLSCIDFYVNYLSHIAVYIVMKMQNTESVANRSP